MTLEKSNGNPLRNGVSFSLANFSLFRQGVYPMMHLVWETGYRKEDTPFPEVKAIQCLTDLSNFCVPKEAIYKMGALPEGQILIEVFASIQRIPVVSWVFPKAEKHKEELYTRLVHQLT